MSAISFLTEYNKVSVGLRGVVHVAVEDALVTLCGRRWWAENSHGDTYCKTCQRKLARKRDAIKRLEEK